MSGTGGYESTRDDEEAKRRRGDLAWPAFSAQRVKQGGARPRMAT